ncbi:MAG: HlyD family secretion protein [Chlamydiota bacterium]
MDNKKKHFYFKFIGIVLGASVFVLGLGFIIYRQFIYVWTNDAFVQGYGVDLSTNVVERITELYVDEGDSVQKGQLLARLYNKVPLAQKQEALASITSLQQEVLVKEANFLKIRNDYERALQGIKDRIISAQEFDHKQKDFEMAEAELNLSYANLDLAKKQLDVIDAQLRNYEIQASEDGVIAKRWVWLGDVMQAGQTLYTMYNLEDVWVLANIEEKKIRKVRLGSSVKIHIDAYPGYTFEGKVFAINGAAASEFSLIPQDTATGNYTKVEQRIPIKISIKKPANFPKNQPLYLFPGISAEVYIDVDK